ncbi:hypothetical protein CRUP_018152 [Coryphaenoides rupestris]|nr:hypothetical protein CRUP_018152 [Coryphaenoides rupestris]
MRDMDLRPGPEPYSLLPSPPMGRSLAEADLESTLPLLPLAPGDNSSSSSSSPATYVNVFPSLSSSSTLAGEDHCRQHHQTPVSKNFAIKVERSPGQVSSSAPYWRPPAGVRRHRSTAPPATAGLRSSSTCSNSSSSSSSSGSGGGSQVVGTAKPSEAETAKRLGQSYGWACERRLSEPGSARRPAGASGSNNTTATMEFFMDRPVQPTFTQERNNLHAVEVTQHFFEAVCTQLERWYQRKVQEATRQAELRAQQDTEQLLQRITALEEELQRLTPSDKTEST